MRTTAKILASLAVIMLTTAAARADSWGISIGGGTYGGGFGFHYSTGSGAFVAAAPACVTPAPVYVAPAPVKVCGPRVIHVSPQVVTHRSWKHSHYVRHPVCAPPPTVCLPPRPVVVVAGCR